MITRNLEQLIIPQPSVPHRTTQEGGHTTERPASFLLLQIHAETTFQLWVT